MAKNPIKIKGPKQILRNLNKKISQIKGGTDKGLIAGGGIIQRAAKKITPVDEGVLINSSFMKLVKRGLVIIGYTAEHAPFVHEMPNTTNFQKPNAENKFLWKGAIRNFRRILDTIRRHAKI